ncbi:LysR family transcriptional regulator [Methylibium sp. Root1272]|uniref:LysR family transcriptional regulator n=1 Tax=Methylibium sp. Root1272 TaxID=1736441 RepID=UPI0009EAAA26|nr:LysR family transcriptional regulator [Methylibium sp. Root1272]
MDMLLSMESFLRVAESGNFSRAAHQLGIVKSVVTTRIKALETHLGHSLFHRSTRAVKLSEAGLQYYHDCKLVIQQIDELNERTRELCASPKGLLRIHVLPGFALGQFASILAGFRALHQGIEFDIVVSDRVVDPVQEGVDLAIQIFPPASNDLIQRQLFPVHGFFCVTPDYLDGNPPIKSPTDLHEHDFATYSYLWGNHWSLTNHRCERVDIDLNPVLRSNSIHLIRDFALRGIGVAYLPTLVASEDLESGNLVRVLPEYSAPTLWLSAVYPASHRSTAKVKIFLDYLRDRCQPFETHIDSARHTTWPLATMAPTMLVNRSINSSDAGLASSGRPQ